MDFIEKKAEVEVNASNNNEEIKSLNFLMKERHEKFSCFSRIFKTTNILTSLLPFPGWKFKKNLPYCLEKTGANFIRVKVLVGEKN